MLCTRCNKLVRPIVALDIDGTMGDFHEHFVGFAIQYLTGRRPLTPPHAEYDGSISMSDWFCRRFQVDYKTWKDIKLAYRQGGLKRSMPAKPWIHNLTYSLREFGVEVWVTTTRPYLRMDNIDPDTRFWLENNRVQFDHLLYDEDKYSQLLSRVGIDRVAAVLDDLPEDLGRAAGLFGRDKCVLFRGSHNVKVWDEWTVVHEQEGVRKEIWERVIEWNRQHELAKV